MIESHVNRRQYRYVTVLIPALSAMMHHVTTEELNRQRDTGNEIPYTLREPSGSIRTSELTDLEQMWWKSVLG